MGKVIGLGYKTENATMISPEQALEDMLDCIRNGSSDGQSHKFKGKKLLILLLDDVEEDDYNVGFSQAGMSMSECLALIEVSKTLLLEQIGY